MQLVNCEDWEEGIIPLFVGVVEVVVKKRSWGFGARRRTPRR